MFKYFFYLLAILITAGIIYGIYNLYYLFPQIHLFLTMNDNYIHSIDTDKSTPDYIIKDVNIIPMNQNKILEHRDVFIKNGTIAEITPSCQKTYQGNYEQIHANGKYLLPGLYDMHVHILNENDLLLYLANGITTVRNMWGFQFLGRDLHLEIKENIKTGKYPGPRIFTAGNFFDGKKPIWPLAYKITSMQDAEEAVKREKKKGYDFIKLYSKLTPQSYDYVIDAAKKYDIKAVGHIPASISIDHALNSGQYTIEHLLGYIDPYGRDSASISPTNYLQYARKTKNSDVWNCPTVCVNEYLTPPGQSRPLPVASKKYLSPYIKKYWTKIRKNQEWLINKFNFDYQSKKQPNRIKMLKTLHEINSNIVVGTDANMYGMVPGFSIHKELQNFVKSGMTPYETLYAATYSAAKCLGDLPHSGTIEEGKRADIILVNHNPLEKIENIKTIVGVMTNGHWFNRNKLDNLLNGLSKYYK